MIAPYRVELADTVPVGITFAIEAVIIPQLADKVIPRVTAGFGQAMQLARLFLRMGMQAVADCSMDRYEIIIAFLRGYFTSVLSYIIPFEFSFLFRVFHKF